MRDPRSSLRVYMYLTVILFAVLLLSGIAQAEKVTVPKIAVIEPHEVGGQYCFITVKIEQEGDNIVKKEVLECADGRKNPTMPGYWDLFAQFYYHDTVQPKYCRKYARPGHAFKSFGTVCLNSNGEWEVQ
jgi:hypothetical protein